jgi:uncharacterized NAD-dependent epimerase/dehydratase family protein
MILTEGQLGVFSAKTANCLIRYCRDEVVCVLDSVAARDGKPLEAILGHGTGIPIVGTIKAGLALKPKQLVIGIAPIGGQLPKPWRRIILDSIRAGLDVVSGLHFALNDDAEIAAAAKKHRVQLADVRVPPADIGVVEDRLRELPQKRIALVGSDCNMGKMVTSVELDRALRARGYDSEFIATGQTGIMIAGSGIAVDHVLSDFVNGAAERLCWERRKRQVVVVEGQGSVCHPAYSGVTVGLLHGALPHAIVYQHVPGRTRVRGYERWPIMPLPEGIALVEQLTQPVFPAKVVAISLNTFGMTNAEADRAATKIEAETGLPAADPIRHGCDKLVRALERMLKLKPKRTLAAKARSA